MTDLYKISKFLKTLGIKNINSNKKDTFIENKKVSITIIKSIKSVFIVLPSKFIILSNK